MKSLLLKSHYTNKIQRKYKNHSTNDELTQCKCLLAFAVVDMVLKTTIGG